jgi:hypothetical protein
MSWQDNIPQRPPQPMVPQTAAQPVRGPRWTKGAKRFEKYWFVDEFWEVVRVRENGRLIVWKNKQGLEAKTICSPTHPDYPPDPTSKQLKADKDADDLEAIQAELWAGTYD